MQTPARALALTALLVVVPGCKEDQGEFGEPEKTDVGNNVKKVDDPNAVASALPDFAGALAVVPSFDPGAKKLMVTLEIKEGFHAYGPGEKIGKPVELSLVDGPWKVEGAVDVPAGQEKDLGELGKSMILEGRVPLAATLSSTDEAAEIAGKVMVQICTDKACDRPRAHEFKLAAR